MTSLSQNPLSPEDRATLITSVKNFRAALAALEKDEVLFDTKVIKRGNKKPLVLEAWAQKKEIPGLRDNIYRMLFRFCHESENNEKAKDH